MNNAGPFQKVGMLKVASANEMIQFAATKPDPVDLYKGLWYEGEVACLFADTNVGKSIYAVQIAEEIAKTQPVLYVDCEMSDKQFQLRYTNKVTMELHKFSDKFFRATISIDAMAEFGLNYEEVIVDQIGKVATEVGAKVIIVDNITFLCLASEDGEAAAKLMMRIIRMKQSDYSILVIAHTPKIRQWEPITINALAGSKKLANFFDTIFAIGKSRKDEKLRYVIQLKVRMGEYRYTSEQVLTCRLESVDGNFLRLNEIGKCAESEMLASPRQNDQRGTAIRLNKEGKDYQAIADELEVPYKTVARWINDYRKAQKVAPNEAPQGK